MPCRGAGGAGCAVKEWDIDFAGDTCLIRKDPAGGISRICLAKARSVRVGSTSIFVRKGDAIEIEFREGVGKMLGPDGDADVEIK